MTVRSLGVATLVLTLLVAGPSGRALAEDAKCNDKSDTCDITVVISDPDPDPDPQRDPSQKSQKKVTTTPTSPASTTPSPPG